MNIFMQRLPIMATLVLSSMIATAMCFANNNDQLIVAQKMYEEGKYSEAINAFNEVLKSIEEKTLPDQQMTQKDAEIEQIVHNYLGKVYKIQGKYDLALKEFEETDGMTDSTNSCALYFIGEIYYLLDDKHGYPVVYWNDAIKESFDTECLLYAYIMNYIVLKTSDVKKANELLENPPWKLKNDMWLKSIVEFWKGKISEKDLLEQAATTVQKVFANYLIGKKYIIGGKIKKAEYYFKEVIETRCYDCIGYDLARKELKR